MHRAFLRPIIAACALLGLLAPNLRADPASGSASIPVSTDSGGWFSVVDQTQAAQPHWMTPIATVTPRLEEEFRYDQTWQKLPTGARLDNFDSGKGLELIPARDIEVILGMPPYEERSRPAESGFADWPFLLIKYRILSANEQNGNYIVSAFLQGTAPTGATVFTNRQYVVTPTLAAGKGWGDFDVQATVGATLPTQHVEVTGRTLVSNVAFQYHVDRLFWPEVELNDTAWLDGPRSGKSQTFLTPGLVIGRIPLEGRFRLAVGVGYQTAISGTTVKPAVPTYNHAWILSVRTPF
jgi:hypothetical protein